MSRLYVASLSLLVVAAAAAAIHAQDQPTFRTGANYVRVDMYASVDGKSIEDLTAEDVQTMGSIGAPGFDLGWAPAISFNGDDPDAIQSAYVTPIPEVEKDHFDDWDWERVRGAVLAVYG